MTPTTLRTLADEADAHRYRTAFGRLYERTLLRAMAAALRAYADAQEGREPGDTLGIERRRTPLTLEAWIVW
jgi:hypothetical protein